MDERGANIDLLFRNGLKDYEVPPPQDAWNDIQPAISKKRSFAFIRVAAAVTVIASLSFVFWMLNRSVEEEIPNVLAVFNIPRSQPVMLAESQHTAAPLPLPESAVPEDIFVPERAEYNAEITVLREYSEDTVSVQRDLEVPVKTAAIAVPEHIIIGDIGKDFPEYYPDVKFPDTRWSVSAMMSPTYHSKTGIAKEEFMKMAATENVSGSYSGGVGLSYKVTRRFTVQTGVYYAQYGQKIEGVTPFAGFGRFASGAKGSNNLEVLTTNGPIRTNNADVFIASDGQSSKVITSPAFSNDVFDPNKENLTPVDKPLIQSLRYIQMPLTIRYKVIDRNIDLNLLGGISYDFLVGDNTSLGDLSIGKTEGLNKLLFSSSVGMGVEYNFSEKVSLNLEPTLRYYLNPFNDAAGTSIHPYSFGVFSGFSYKF